jgi:hypothetical protein
LIETIANRIYFNAGLVFRLLEAFQADFYFWLGVSPPVIANASFSLLILAAAKSDGSALEAPRRRLNPTL